MSETVPPANTPMDALRLIAELDREAGELYALAEQGTPSLEEVAGYRHRRAHVWVHLAQQREEFEDKARAEVAAWRKAEDAVIAAVAAAAMRGHDAASPTTSTTGSLPWG